MSSSARPGPCLRTACSVPRTISPTQYITTVASISFASGRPSAVIEDPISRVNLCETKCLTTISEGTKAASIAGWEYLQERGLWRRANDALTAPVAGARLRDCSEPGWILETTRVGAAGCLSEHQHKRPQEEMSQWQTCIPR